jgi:hypothetical protein
MHNPHPTRRCYNCNENELSDGAIFGVTLGCAREGLCLACTFVIRSSTRLAQSIVPYGMRKRRATGRGLAHDNDIHYVNRPTYWTTVPARRTALQVGVKDVPSHYRIWTLCM